MIGFLDNDAIGNIFTECENLDNNSISVIFNIHPNFWGKGYAPEALVATINYLFKIGYDNIICNYVDGNKKAKRVLNKLGFKAYEIKEDSYQSAKKNLIDVYSTLVEKEEWLSRTSKIKL